jgi:hypothetical protein
MPRCHIVVALERAGRELQLQYGDEPIPRGELVTRTARLARCSPSSVLPSDFAFNRVNRDVVSRARPMFIHEGRGQYRFVGPDYAYRGPILWQPAGEHEREVGRSVDGKATFQRDPRLESSQFIEDSHQ